MKDDGSNKTTETAKQKSKQAENVTQEAEQTFKKPLVNKHLMGAKRGDKKTSEMTPEEKLAIKRNKYALQSASRDIGDAMRDGLIQQGRGSEYAPEAGALRKAARAAVNRGETRGGRTDFASDAATTSTRRGLAHSGSKKSWKENIEEGNQSPKSPSKPPFGK